MWVSHGVTSPTRKPAAAWAPLSTGLQVPAPVWPSHEVTAPSQTSTCSSMVLSTPWAAGGSLHPLTSMDCIPAPVPGAPPVPASPVTLVSIELLLSHILPTFFCGCNYNFAVILFSSQISYQRDLTTVPAWLSLGQQHVHLELARIAFAGYEGGF